MAPLCDDTDALELAGVHSHTHRNSIKYEGLAMKYDNMKYDNSMQIIDSEFKTGFSTSLGRNGAKQINSSQFLKNSNPFLFNRQKLGERGYHSWYCGRCTCHCINYGVLEHPYL